MPRYNNYNNNNNNRNDFGKNYRSVTDLATFEHTWKRQQKINQHIVLTSFNGVVQMNWFLLYSFWLYSA